MTKLGGKNGGKKSKLVMRNCEKQQVKKARKKRGNLNWREKQKKGDKKAGKEKR